MRSLEERRLLPPPAVEYGMVCRIPCRWRELQCFGSAAGSCTSKKTVLPRTHLPQFVARHRAPTTAHQHFARIQQTVDQPTFHRTSVSQLIVLTCYNVWCGEHRKGTITSHFRLASKHSIRCETTAEINKANAGGVQGVLSQPQQHQSGAGENPPPPNRRIKRQSNRSTEDPGRRSTTRDKRHTRACGTPRRS